MGRIKKYGSQTNPVKVKEEDKEMFNNLFKKLRDMYYLDLNNVNVNFEYFRGENNARTDKK